MEGRERKIHKFIDFCVLRQKSTFVFHLILLLLAHPQLLSVSLHYQENKFKYLSLLHDITLPLLSPLSPSPQKKREQKNKENTEKKNSFWKNNSKRISYILKTSFQDIFYLLLFWKTNSVSHSMSSDFFFQKFLSVKFILKYISSLQKLHSENFIPKNIIFKFSF